MKFECKYRSKDGDLCREILDTDSRDLAYHELRERGIVPITITEFNENSNIGIKTRRMFFVVTGVIVIITLIGISIKANIFRKLFITSGNDSREDKVVERHTNFKIDTNSSHVKAREPVNQTEYQQDLSDVELSLNPNANSNVADVVLEEAQRLTSNAVFKTRLDQLLVIALSGSNMKSMPPMPLIRISEKEFRDSIATKIEVHDFDSDEIKELKKAVIEARAEMLEQINNGRTVQEVLQEHTKLRNENNRTRRDAQLELNAIFASGDLEGAKRYYEKINVELEKLGAPKLRMPKSQAEKERSYQERKQRVLERHRLQQQMNKLKQGEMK